MPLELGAPFRRPHEPPQLTDGGGAGRLLVRPPNVGGQPEQRRAVLVTHLVDDVEVSPVSRIYFWTPGSSQDPHFNNVTRRHGYS